MYTDFYNLAEKPFDLTHSSRYLYLGEVHKEALSMLTYGVMERKGFVLLTGEVGTGKTTILRAMLNDLDNNVKYVHLANPLLSPKEFMNYLTLSAFRNRISFKSKAEFLLAFEAFLTRCSQHQKHFLLVIDEAQKLSYELLEEIRLLSNMETADEKLISIFLVGQPELNQKLGDPKCRALLQRISIRYNIKPLNLKETEEYIEKRLKVAGAEKADDIFPSGVRKAIHECSSGFPRMINVLSDNVLLLGYSRGQRKLTPAMVRECYEDMGLSDAAPVRAPEPETKIIERRAEPRPSHGRGGFWKWALVALLAIVLAAAGFYFRDEIRSGVTKLVDKYAKPASALPTEKRTHAPLPGKSEERAAEKKTEETVPSPLSPPTSPPPSPLSSHDTTSLRGSDLPAAPPRQAGKNEAVSELSAIREIAALPRIPGRTGMFDESGVARNEYEGTTQPLREEGSAGASISPPLVGGDEGEGEAGKRALSRGSDLSGYRNASRGDPGQTVIVQDGDSLDKLARRIYGRSDEKIWEMIQKSNPGMQDVDLIRPGQSLFFPPLPEERSAISDQQSAVRTK